MESNSVEVKYTAEEAEAAEVYAFTHPDADACDGFLAACIAMREKRGIYNHKNLEAFTAWLKSDACKLVNADANTYLIVATGDTLKVSRMWDYFNETIVKK